MGNCMMYQLGLPDLSKTSARKTKKIDFLEKSNLIKLFIGQISY